MPGKGMSATKGRSIVVDIGKTNAKVSLWSLSGELVERRVRTNARPPPCAHGYPVLDVNGIDKWLLESMRELAALGDVARIVTVGHGAAAALIRNGKLYAEPMDYEVDVEPAFRADYDAQRDRFEETGSPALPQGLNLGVQIHLLESVLGPLPDDVVIVPWPQYWAWRFSGVPASEVTSLGCHTDLWQPTANAFSRLAEKRGWAGRMAPLRRAADVLGPVTAELAAATGLNPDCQVLCGLHDSNAALLAARGHEEVAVDEATVLSTGTWFVAMRSVAVGVEVDIGKLDQARDCLVNVDACGRPTPCSRFMGGREAELASGVDSFRLTDDCEPDTLLARLPALVANGVNALPAFVARVGPFPYAQGQWRNKPADPLDLRAATDLYLALVANAALDLVGSKERLLIEGRFAQDAVFVRALATLRPDQRVFASNSEHDVAHGALRLIDSTLTLASELATVEPLQLDLATYAAKWREQVAA